MPSFYSSGQGGTFDCTNKPQLVNAGSLFYIMSISMLFSFTLDFQKGKSWNCERGYEISSNQAFRKVLFCDICVRVWKCVYSIKLWANICKDSSLSNKSAEWRELYRMISKAYTWQLYIFYETVMHPVPFLNSLFYGCSISILADRIYWTNVMV